MNRLKKATVLVMLAVFLAAPCGAADNDDPSPRFQDNQIKIGEMVGDTVIARPLGIVTTVLGFGFFVISSPFSAMGGNTDEAWDTLVKKPAQFTFTRPLGEFD